MPRGRRRCDAGSIGVPSTSSPLRGASGPEPRATGGARGIEVCRITKRFGNATAVDDLSLEIEAGSFFAMLGPSGCGKTTTLRIIGGFESPDAGSVILGATDVTRLPPWKRDVNTVFQSYALFPHLTVGRNVAFGLERQKVSRNEIRRRTGEALELVQLGGLECRRPVELSGGQQQRVALARALVNRPKALLLDEPLGALDLRLRRQLQVELKRIQQEVQLTFVHVTHDQEEAMSMADTIAVMNKGRVEQQGSAVDLYERPRTEFVASFLGASNLVDGRLRSRDSRMAHFETSGHARLRVSADSCPMAIGDAVRLGVRPEKILLAPVTEEARLAPDHNLLRGHIALSTFQGVAIHYVVSTAGGDQVTVVAQNRNGTAAGEHQPGDEVLLAWAPSHTFVVSR